MGEHDVEPNAGFRESDAWFAAMFSDSPVGMAIVSADGTFRRVNRALSAMLGFSEAELLGLQIHVIAHPDDADVDAPHLRQLLSGAIDCYQVEKRYRHRVGATRWGSLAVSVVRDESGRPRHYVAQVVDITAAKEAEQSLRDANARLAALFEHSPVLLSLRGMDGRYLDVNATLAALLGSTREAAIGRHPGEFSHSKAVFDTEIDDREVWETREPVSREMTITQPDGRHTYQTIRFPVLDDAGEVAAIGSFAMDTTDRQRADTMRDQALRDLEDAQRIAEVGSWTWDAVSDTAHWSDELFRIHGRDPARGAPGARDMFAYIVREDRRRAIEAYKALLGGRSVVEADYRIAGDDGVERLVHTIARADPETPGTFRGTVQDVTAIRATERDIRIVQERFRRAFEHAPVGMAITSPDGHFLQVNEALRAMLGYSRDEMVQLTVPQVNHPDELARRDEAVEAMLEGRIDHVHLDERLRRADGTWIWVSRHTAALHDAGGETMQLLSHVVDLTERRRLEDELRHLADHDPLTGLLNRRGLETQLERHIAHVQRYGDRGALLILDLDRFKVVNDTRGHGAGDRLLIAVAQMLRGRLRVSDSIARLGGDEFAILLPEADAETSERVAREIVAEIPSASEMFDGGDHKLRITASIGVTTFTREITSSRGAQVDADLAMYHAKEAGRNRVAVHGRSISQPAP